MAQVITKESYSEFINYSKNTGRHPGNSTESEKTNQNEWQGSSSIEESYDFAENGWDAGIAQLELDTDLTTVGVTEPERAIVGAYPDIGAYLQNQPDCMWQYVDATDYNLPEIEIFVPLVYAGHKTGEEAMKYCKAIISIVNKYQSNHNVKLTGVFMTAQDNGVTYINEVFIKEFNSQFVLNNIAFSFHPSFFRRIWCKKLETETFIARGYGKVLPDSDIKNYIINREEGITSEKAIMLQGLQTLHNITAEALEESITDIKEIYLKRKAQ